MGGAIRGGCLVAHSGAERRRVEPEGGGTPAAGRQAGQRWLAGGERKRSSDKDPEF